MKRVPFFSVVVPIYNGMLYIERALTALRNQTFPDFEVLLVDDCSTDKSKELCRKWEQKDRRFRLIALPENAGAANARNEGIRSSEGIYLGFMDVDDTIDENLLEMVYESLQKNPAKLVIFGHEEVYYNQGKVVRRQPFCPRNYIAHTKEEVRQRIMELEKQTLYGYPWNKFYLRDYVIQKGIFFENLPLLEDLKFNIQYAMEIDSMNVIGKTPYHYRILQDRRKGNSLTSRYVKEYFKIHENCVNDLYQQQIFWGICDEGVKSDLGRIYVRYIFSAIQQNCDKRSHMTYGMRKQWICRLYQRKLYQELLPYTKADSRILQLMIWLLKGKHTHLCLCAGRIIYIIKNQFSTVFIKVKGIR